VPFDHRDEDSKPEGEEAKKEKEMEIDATVPYREDGVQAAGKNVPAKLARCVEYTQLYNLTCKN